eukprot:5124980-Prymnesium_polylepis.1
MGAWQPIPHARGERPRGRVLSIRVPADPGPREIRPGCRAEGHRSQLRREGRGGRGRVGRSH